MSTFVPRQVVKVPHNFYFEYQAVAWALQCRKKSHHVRSAKKLFPAKVCVFLHYKVIFVLHSTFVKPLKPVWNSSRIWFDWSSILETWIYLDIMYLFLFLTSQSVLRFNPLRVWALAGDRGANRFFFGAVCGVPTVSVTTLHTDSQEFLLQPPTTQRRKPPPQPARGPGWWGKTSWFPCIDMGFLRILLNMIYTIIISSGIPKKS